MEILNRIIVHIEDSQGESSKNNIREGKGFKPCQIDVNYIKKELENLQKGKQSGAYKLFNINKKSTLSTGVNNILSTLKLLEAYNSTPQPTKIPEFKK
jgi:hypothetical protein